MTSSQTKATDSTFRQIFKKIPGLYLVLKPEEYKIVAASDDYLKATKNERSDILGLKLFEKFPDPENPQHESMQNLRGSLEKVKAEQCTDNMPITHHPISVPENGFEDRWWSPVNTPIFNEEGSIDYIIHRLEDVTPVIQKLQSEENNLIQKLKDEDAHLTADILLRGQDLQEAKEQAYRQLLKSEKKYRTLFKSIKEGFCIIEVLFNENDAPTDFRFLETNPSFEELTDIREAEGKRVKEISTEIEDNWFQVLDKIIKTQEPTHFEKSARSKGRFFNIYAFPVGKPEDHKVAALFNDITEQKETENSLRESRTRLQAALEIDNVGILFWDEDFNICEANEAILQMSGFSYEELMDKSWKELSPPKSYSRSKEAISNLETAGHTEPYEKQYYRKDGSCLWALVASRRINEHECVEYVVDITERKHREERDQLLLRLNDELRPLSNPEEIQSKATEILGLYLDADRVLYIEAKSENDQFTIKNDYTDGVSSVVGQYSLEDLGPSLMERLRAGHTYTANNILRDPNLPKKEKEHYQDINTQSKLAVPLVKDDRLVGVLAAHQSEPREWTEQEITLLEETAERTWAYVEQSRTEEMLVNIKETLEDRVAKRTETLKSYQSHLRSLTSKLNQAEEQVRRRLAAELHDNLGQLLTLGKMKAQNLRGDYIPDETNEDITELSELIDKSLTYTRDLISELKPPPTVDEENFRAVLEWTANNMENYDLDVTIEEDEQEKPLSADMRSTLHQSVRELLLNIVKYAEVDEARIQFFREDNKIKTIVEDQGVGFDVNEKALKPSDEGGYGLFNIQERLNWLGGDMEIFSAPGEGTKTVLTVPVKEDIRQSHVKEKATEPSPEKEEIGAELSEKVEILLVDDHEMMRRGLRNIIDEQDDLSITAEASDGKKAVELARKTSPDIIIMDINLPAMNGIEATKKIMAAEDGKTSIIGLSLHKKEEVDHDLRSAGASAYLSKDEAFETLCATIRSEAAMVKK